ncbi:MAG: hydrogenase expression/formation protein HypE [Gammaproteobacteria bacterium]|nr:hydrogenase expression/formation protein HypE [Gammaproteobacteria bacterium]
MQDTHISLAHGNGGRYMRELIEQVFAHHLANPLLDIEADAVPMPIPEGEIMLTTDGFTVQPLEFPGGDIGALAVHGTVNDLAVAGATPLYLTLNALIEEGLEIAQLQRVIASLARSARETGVQVVAGDTKVVPRGAGGGLYLSTSGVGVRAPGVRLSMRQIREGDAILVSGPVGDHAVAVLLAREQFGLRGNIQSDMACVLPLTRALLTFAGLRFMRDPTRGGLATVLHEICRATNLGVQLEEAAIPVNPAVRSVCDMLGYEPLYLACEGRVVAVVAPDQAQTALAAWHTLPLGNHAAIVGRVTNKVPRVTLETPIGGRRTLEELEDDPLPRIC